MAGEQISRDFPVPDESVTPHGVRVTGTPVYKRGKLVAIDTPAGRVPIA